MFLFHFPKDIDIKISLFSYPIGKISYFEKFVIFKNFKSCYYLFKKTTNYAKMDILTRFTIFVNNIFTTDLRFGHY